jgi:transcriptional regulator with XRE-family HTH domain
VQHSLSVASGPMPETATAPVGALLRDWRRRRSLSQLELSLSAAVSARHLSFVETGRSQPSCEMVLHLADQLDVPLRERNQLLLAAGYAPLYPERPLDSEEMESVRDALDRFLRAHEPYPAVVVDRHHNLLAANDALELLTEGVAPELMAAPANGLRVTLHPDGMAPRIANLGEWSAHLLHRLRRQVAVTGDEALERLYEELAGYPGVETEPPSGTDALAGIAVPLRIRSGREELAFLSTLSTFGTAIDITLAELAIEAFYPANGQTALRLLRGVDP